MVDFLNISTLDKIIEKVLFESKVRYNSSNVLSINQNTSKSEVYDTLSKMVVYHDAKAADNYNQSVPKKANYNFTSNGYIFVPSGVILKRMSQQEIGYGTLGIAIKSIGTAGFIGILDSLYGNDFEEVLSHEAIHLENWDWSEAKVRYETAQRVKSKFEPRFH